VRDTPWTPFVIPNVIEVECFALLDDGPNSVAVFSPETFPSLRYLALTPADEDDNLLSVTMLSQLSSLTIEANVFCREYRLPQASHSCKILYRIDLADVERHGLALLNHQYLRLDFSPTRTDGPSAPDYLVAFSRLLHDRPDSPLRRLYLPAQFFTLKQHELSPRNVMKDILAFCQAQQIDVDYDASEASLDNTCFSPKFEAHVAAQASENA
jgi:hypothetical protein